MKTRNAFTLLEILISVVVLAIGLVGVVAIFPAVIDLQRRAQDSVIGTAAATSAEARLVGTFIQNESLDWYDWDGEFGSNTPRSDMFPAFSILKLDRGISERDARTFDGATAKVYDFLWDARWEWQRQENRDALDVLDSTGDLVLGGGLSYKDIVDPQNVLPQLTLDLGQRLLPDAASQADPRYVYDFVVRRVDAGIGLVPRGNARTYEKLVRLDRVGELPVQMAVFVRRVDRNIRLPQGVSIREALTGVNDDPDVSTPIPNSERRFPLAVRSDDLCQIVNNGKPASGDVVYSRPVAAFIRNETIQQSNTQTGVWDLFDPSTLRLTGSGSSATCAEAALKQPGQLFVDNNGTVRKVVAIVDKQVGGNDRELLMIDPPFPTNSINEIRQIVFTPQVPVGIRVLTTR